MRFRSLAGFWWLVPLLSVGGGCGSSKTIATVNGRDVGEQEFISQMISSHGHGMETLQWLLEYNLIMDECKRKNIKITEKEIDLAIRENQRRGGHNPEDWQREVRNAGGTLEDTRRQREYEIGLFKLITEGVKVSDAEVKKIYDDNQPSFIKPPQVQLARITLRTPDEAAKVSRRLGEGGQFSELVKEYSLDPGEIRDRGGALDSVPANQVPAEYQKALEKLSLDTPSAPFESGGLWLIVKVVKQIPAEKVKFDDVKSYIHDQESLQRAARKGRTAGSVLMELARKARLAIKDARMLPLEQQFAGRVASKASQMGGGQPASEAPPAKSASKAPAPSKPEAARAKSRSGKSG